MSDVPETPPLDVPVAPETYSPFPQSIRVKMGGAVPTLKELEDVRQAALLYLSPVDETSQQAMVHMASVLVMSIQGKSEKEIAETLGIKRSDVRTARRALQERNLLGDAVKSAVERLTTVAIPLAVDNVIEQLEKGDEKATNRVLDTFGIGPSKGAGVNGDAPVVPKVPVLNLNLNLPPGVSIERANTIPASGKIVGRGKDQPRLEKASPDAAADNALTLDVLPADGASSAI